MDCYRLIMEARSATPEELKIPSLIIGAPDICDDSATAFINYIHAAADKRGIKIIEDRYFEISVPLVFIRPVDQIREIEILLSYLSGFYDVEGIMNSLKLTSATSNTPDETDFLIPCVCEEVVKLLEELGAKHNDHIAFIGRGLSHFSAHRLIDKGYYGSSIFGARLNSSPERLKYIFNDNDYVVNFGRNPLVSKPYTHNCKVIDVAANSHNIGRRTINNLLDRVEDYWTDCRRQRVDI